MKKSLLIALLTIILVVSCLALTACHSCEFGEWEVTTPATCTQIGQEKRVCSCGEFEVRDIPATGHNYINRVCVQCGFIDPSEGLAYTLSSDGMYYSVTGKGTCTDTYVVIPSTYNGLPVTSIGEHAFYACSNLTKVTIPSSVISIGDFAFGYCYSLTSITIPENVISIGSGAFSASSLDYCEYDNAYYLGNEINNYTILVKAKSTDITSCVIHENTKVICDNAFVDCTSLITVAFEEGSQLTSIGDLAFYNCSSLTSIKIPGNITSIGSHAFNNCSNLTSITFEEGSHLTSIGPHAFNNCSILTSITIPEGVTNIGIYAFYNCSSLTSITLPFVGNTLNGTTKAHFGYIFGAPSHSENSSCVPSSLKTVVITGGTSIGHSAFRDCNRLTSITIPSSVQSIGQYAFYNCTSLTTVTFEEGSRLTSIDDLTFYNCSSLLTVNIEECSRLTSIGDLAFYSCSSLTSVTIPSRVTSIGDGAFNYCNSLTTITLPSSITSIGNGAFSKSSRLSDVYYAGSSTQWNKISIGTNNSYLNRGSIIHFNYTGEEN